MFKKNFNKSQDPYDQDIFKQKPKLSDTMFKKSMLIVDVVLICLLIFMFYINIPKSARPKTATYNLGDIEFTAPIGWQKEDTDKNGITLYPYDTDGPLLSIRRLNINLNDFSDVGNTAALYVFSNMGLEFEPTNQKEVTVSGFPGFNFTGTATTEDQKVRVSATTFTSGSYMYNLIHINADLSDFSNDADVQKIIDSIKVKEQPDSKAYQPGTYKVGTDIPAGEYLFTTTDSGYVSLSTDNTENPNSILSQETFSYRHLQTIKDGQYLNLKDCDAILLSSVYAIVYPDGIYVPGMYKVGPEIMAGEYTVKAISSNGSITILRDSLGSPSSIVSNDNFVIEKDITIKEGQYVKIKNCELIPKQIPSL